MSHDGNIDIILLPETKLIDTFPVSQFLIDGFHAPHRVDRTGNWGGLLLFVRDASPNQGNKS